VQFGRLVRSCGFVGVAAVTLAGCTSGSPIGLSMERSAGTTTLDVLLLPCNGDGQRSAVTVRSIRILDGPTGGKAQTELLRAEPSSSDSATPDVRVVVGSDQRPFSIVSDQSLDIGLLTSADHRLSIEIGDGSAVSRGDIPTPLVDDQVAETGRTTTYPLADYLSRADGVCSSRRRSALIGSVASIAVLGAAILVGLYQLMTRRRRRTTSA
jgi:hypothetical protein